MNIVVLHNGSSLGKRIVRTWKKKYGQNGEFELVVNCSLDNLVKYRPKLVCLASDMASPFEQLVLEKCRELRLSIFPVLGRGGVALLGPLETPGKPGCATCVQLRFENTFERSLFSMFNSGEPEPLGMSKSDLFKLGFIATDEIHSIVGESVGESPNPPKSEAAVAVYEHAGNISWVPVVPSHDCPRCNLVPEDNSELAKVQFASHILKDYETLRVGTVDLKQLEELYFHPQVGYISAIHETSTEDGYVQADAYIYTPSGHDIAGYGSGSSSIDAKRSAIFEVLERSCGLHAVSRRPVFFARYRDLADLAVHPSQFGLHNYDLLQALHPLPEPFAEEKEYSWVFAHSTKHHLPVLIPEQIAYYGPTVDEKRFVTETSNGCAIGGTMEEAVLHGVFEVLERDGFLNMWYGKMPVPELTLGRHGPSQTLEAIQYLADRGFDVRLFALSHDLGIPAICAVAINRENGYPKVVSGSACHLNARQAVHGALREVTVQVVNLRRAPEEKRNEALSMLQDPTKVRKILDHVAVAALPEAAPRWEFLLEPREGRRIQSVEEAYSDVNRRYHMDTKDIRRILNSVLDDLHGRGFDVIVLNQTSSEVSYGGLHAVKVLIPGMTPITFGYGFQRVRGLRRLFELPYRMGYAPQVLTEDDLNQDCHPFS